VDDCVCCVHACVHLRACVHDCIRVCVTLCDATHCHHVACQCGMSAVASE